ADIGADIDAVVSTFGALGDADVVVPETEANDIADAPACRDDADLAAGVAAVAEVLLDVELDSVTAAGGVLTSVGEYIRR
ncbi:ParA family protein, partial [Haloferax sp. AB510]|nr:ParA family protein [Haloferax sp. AB510]